MLKIYDVFQLYINIYFQVLTACLLFDCDAEHPKSQWLYNEQTGQISAKNFPDFCVQSLGGTNRRVEMQACDVDEPDQRYDYDTVLGRIFVRGSSRCLSINAKNYAVVTLGRCWTSSFGYFE